MLRTAGRNQSAIQYHFGSRDELIFALLERGRRREIADRTRMLDTLAARVTPPDPGRSSPHWSAVLRRSRLGTALRLLIETTADRARVVEVGG